MSFLFLDCETGGIGPEYSLLTTYFLLVDEQFNKIDDFPLYLRPDNGIYQVCGEAMNVNRIDLKVHDTKAITYKEAGKKLYEFLKNYSKDGADKLTIVGHNVAGDRNCICQNLMNRGTWDKFCSYRLRDTQTIACFLIDCGIIKDISGSLESLTKYFGILNNENDFHDAKYDTEKTMEVYKSLVDMITNMNVERVLGRYLV